MNNIIKPAISTQLFVAAAISVIVVCSLGAAAIVGWIPPSAAGQAVTTGGPVANPPAGVDAYAPPPYAATAAPNSGLAATSSAQQFAINTPAPPAPLAAGYCGNCGTVENIREYEVKKAPSGLGLVGGALIGGLIGHQFFGGRGNVVSTLGGAAGGAYVGNKVEENHHAGSRYAVTVRLEDGTTHVLRYRNTPKWHEGDRIKYEHGHLEAAA
jgi:uncharacterized protein YcfJ